jgi:hypothetical protein
MEVTDSITRQIEPITGTLCTAGGARLKEDAAPWSAVLTPPPEAVQNRQGERLFILLDLAGPASPHLYRELRQVVAQTYWTTAGSITAALRKAAAAANHYLFQANLRYAPSDRCYGSLACAVSRGEDLFTLQAGPGRVCVLHGSCLDCFPPGDEELPQLGMGALTDVRLHHAFVTIGDTLLLTSSTLIQAAGDVGLTRVLPMSEVQDLLAGLEQMAAGADFAALVARWAPPSAIPQATAVREAPKRIPRPKRKRAVSRPTPKPPEPRVHPETARRRPGPGLGKRVSRRILGTAHEIGHGIVAAGAWTGSSAKTLFRRMLPGPERDAHRRARPPRPIPEENPIVMTTIAIGILVVVAATVTLAYGSFGRDARLQSFVQQAKGEITLAEAAWDNPEESQLHWEAALVYSDAAARLQPDDPEVARLQTQAQAALDRLGSIIRVTPIQLWEFGQPWKHEAGTVPPELIVHGQMVFVLDPENGWLVKLTLTPSGDGVVEEDFASHVVRTGQQVEEQEIGKLIDFTWVEPGGERQTSGLIILEEGGVLIGCDLVWEDDSGTPKLAHSLLSTPPSEAVRAVGSYEGRFYILDAGADQILRYEPRGDVYPDQPDRYFVTSPPKPLETAVDMAIDGNIYILYSDGTILKFLSHERQPFDVHGVPDGFDQAIALTVDPGGNSGFIYVADRGNDRVVVLRPDGSFHAQYRAESNFDELEALAVDESGRRLFVISGGRLYSAPLP